MSLSQDKEPTGHLPGGCLNESEALLVRLETSKIKISFGQMTIDPQLIHKQKRQSVAE